MEGDVKEYYVITTGVCGVPWERAVAGPWEYRKEARLFRRKMNRCGVPGKKIIVKRVR